MPDFIARLFEPLLRLLFPGRGRHRPTGPRSYVYPYSCRYVGGPSAYRTGERPVRGEDSPLVRPYLEAHERELEEAAVAEARQQRARRRALWLAVHGVDVGPRFIHGVQVAS